MRGAQVNAGDGEAHQSSEEMNRLVALLDRRFENMEEILRQLPSTLGAAIATHSALAGQGPRAVDARSRASSGGSITLRDPNAKKPTVMVGVCFQVCNLYDLDAANSRFRSGSSSLRLVQTLDCLLVLLRHLQLRHLCQSELD